MNRAYRQSLVGTEQDVLFEECVDGYDTGHAPNYMKVYVPTAGRHNEVIRVKLTDLYADGLWGEELGNKNKGK